MTELERELLVLGRQVEFPPTPDLAGGVRRRIEAAPVRAARARRRALVLALAALVAVVAGVLAVPQARTALLELLGLRGVVVERVATTPTAPATADLGLGMRVPLAEVRDRVSFRVALPRGDDPGPPDETYVGAVAGSDQVAFVWTDEGEVELLLTQFRARLLPEAVHKVVGPGTTVTEVDVDGSRGFWIQGEPHAFVYVAPDGEPVEETFRLAGDTLLWARGGVTFRLEGADGRAEALRVARATG